MNWKQDFALKTPSQNKHDVLINTIINLNWKKKFVFDNYL